MRKVFISASLLFFAFFIGNAQSLESILQAHYKAASLEKLQKMNTIITTGKNVYTTTGIESVFTLYQLRPNLIRIEADYVGSKFIQTYNGEKGWMYAPAMGITEPKELTNQELESILNQAEFETPLWNYEAKGSSLELIEASEEGSADHLKLTNGNGDVMNFFLDKKSHLISSIRSTQQMGSSQQEIEINMKDYKNVKGIPVAHYVETKVGGQIVYTIHIEKVEYNKDLDSTLFEKPEED